jgi:hypothetical protein
MASPCIPGGESAAGHARRQLIHRPWPVTGLARPGGDRRLATFQQRRQQLDLQTLRTAHARDHDARLKQPFPERPLPGPQTHVAVHQPAYRHRQRRILIQHEHQPQETGFGRRFEVKLSAAFCLAIAGNTTPTWNGTSGADVRARNRRGAQPRHAAVTGMPGSANWNAASDLARPTTARGGTGSPHAKSEQRLIIDLFTRATA